jgi:NADPH2 dehydrogenase
MENWGKSTPILIADENTASNVFEAADMQYMDYNVVFVFGRHFSADPDLPFQAAKWD